MGVNVTSFGLLFQADFPSVRVGEPRSMGKQTVGFVIGLAALFLVATGARTETNSVSVADNPPVEDAAAWSRHVVQAYQQLQEQQQTTLRSVEEARQQATAATRGVESARQDAEAAAQR